MEIDQNRYHDLLVRYNQLYSFVSMVSNGKRPDGTYNYCREALEKIAKQLVERIDNGVQFVP
jgi:hypothetical protein